MSEFDFLKHTRIYQDAKAEGRRKAQVEIALRLLEQGRSLEETAEILELSIADLQHLTQQSTDR